MTIEEYNEVYLNIFKEFAKCRTPKAVYSVYIKHEAFCLENELVAIGWHEEIPETFKSLRPFKRYVTPITGSQRLYHLDDNSYRYQRYNKRVTEGGYTFSICPDRTAVKEIRRFIEGENDPAFIKFTRAIYKDVAFMEPNVFVLQHILDEVPEEELRADYRAFVKYMCMDRDAYVKNGTMNYSLPLEEIEAIVDDMATKDEPPFIHEMRHERRLYELFVYLAWRARIAYPNETKKQIAFGIAFMSQHLNLSRLIYFLRILDFLESTTFFQLNRMTQPHELQDAAKTIADYFISATVFHHIMYNPFFEHVISIPYVFSYDKAFMEVVSFMRVINIIKDKRYTRFAYANDYEEKVINLCEGYSSEIMSQSYDIFDAIENVFRFEHK